MILWRFEVRWLGKQEAHLLSLPPEKFLPEYRRLKDDAILKSWLAKS